MLEEVRDAIPTGLKLTCRQSDGVFVGDVQGVYPQETLDRTLEHFDKLLSRSEARAPALRSDGRSYDGGWPPPLIDGGRPFP